MEYRHRYLELLSGEGIEIGALHRPVSAPHLKVKYVDRLTKADLYKQYPELLEYPIVEADILDDGETLKTIAENSFDFVIANHVIEHMANPILSIKNWLRVLKPGGRVFIAVPNPSTTFDNLRPITKLDHIMLDYNSPSDERDYEHFKEFALLVSCKIFGVIPESEAENFAKKLWDTKYSIHYHVWTFDTFKEFLSAVFDTVPYPIKVVDSMAPIRDEFIFVLEKC